MEKPEVNGDPKAKADREKFESIVLLPVPPLTIKRSAKHTPKLPKLQSPDEKNPKWVPDPEDLMAERKAAKKEKSDPKPQA